MPDQIAELSQLFKELITSTGSVEGQFSNIDSPDACSKTSLVFVSDEAALPNFDELTPAAIVTDAKIASSISVSCPVLVTHDVRLAQALIKQRYQDYDATDPEWDPLHPSAVIHPSAQWAEGVRVGPNAVISANVKIDQNTVILAGSVIESGVKIGADSIIHSLGIRGQIYF